MKRVSLLMMLAAAIAVAQPAGNADSGKKLFVRDGCWQCHGYAGQGSRDGARIGATALTQQGCSRHVRRPTGAMPAFTEKVVTDQELADIYAYLKSMPAPKPAKDIPLLNQI